MAKINYKAITLTLGLIAFSFLFVWYVFAQWKEPTAAPPEANVPAPINVGPITQTKTGGLNLATDSGALVGIGTTNPSTRLDVNGVTTASGFTTTSGNAPGSVAYRANIPNNGYSFFSGYIGTDANSMFRIRGWGGLEWGPGGTTAPDTNLFRSTANVLRTNDSLIVDGKVGIGTTDPAEKLHVAGSVRANRWIDDDSNYWLDINLTTSRMRGLTIGQNTAFSGNNFRNLNVLGELKSFGTGGGFRMEDRTAIGTSGAEWVIYANSNNLRFWRGANGDLMTLNNGGDMALYGSSPQLKFQDSTSGEWDYWIHQNSNRLYFLNDGGGGGGWTSARPLTIYKNNVGIGTSSPGANLDVNGTFRLGSQGTIMNKIGTSTQSVTTATINGVPGQPLKCPALYTIQFWVGTQWSNGNTKIFINPHERPANYSGGMGAAILEPLDAFVRSDGWARARIRCSGWTGTFGRMYWDFFLVRT